MQKQALLPGGQFTLELVADTDCNSSLVVLAGSPCIAGAAISPTWRKVLVLGVRSHGVQVGTLGQVMIHAQVGLGDLPSCRRSQPEGGMPSGFEI
jgi:hypothetical protein